MIKSKIAILCYAITMDFKNHLKKYLNDSQIDELIASFDKKEHKGFYLNVNKMSEDTLLSLYPNVKRHPVVPNGYLFDQDEYKLGKSIYHELGAFYIQDPSAMLVAHYLAPKPGQKILDLCAAPGGKTTMTSLLMKNEGLLLSNDLSKSRANILLQNIERMGLGNVIVTSYDFKNFYADLNESFDAIILDAPCSGSGMFRKLEEMKDDWTYEKVLKNASIQKELILMAYSMLKEGGTLFYSTCSYSYEEDEEVIEHLLVNSDAKLEYIEDQEGYFRSPKYKETIHLFPHLFVGEGHYIAKIKKPGNLVTSKDEKITIKRATSSKGNSKQISTFLINKNLPNKILDYALRPGLFIDTKIADKSIPSHHYSHFANASNSIELNKEEAIKFIKGESLRKNNLKQGYQFVSYLKMNIGVAHVIGDTIKNLYPKGLRHTLDIDDSF